MWKLNVFMQNRSTVKFYDDVSVPIFFLFLQLNWEVISLEINRYEFLSNKKPCVLHAKK